MPQTAASLATRYAGRPLLMTPRAALEVANRVRAVDPASVAKPGRFSALLRKLSGDDRRPAAMEDDDDYVPVPMETRLAYAPLYAGEPDDYGYCWALKDGVAMMQVDKPLLDRGEIFCGEVYHGYDTILQALREANADDRVRGIFIREQTPGGVVAGGLPALAEWMRENGARGGGKPIHVHADMACSAGYWIAASADHITAPRVGLIGSIGAVIVHENWSGALKEAGVEITPIQFGASKTDGAWWAALSDGAREDLQAEIDQCGRDFVADVIAGRPQLSPEEVIATQARVFMGHHDDAARSALALKLVDAHGSEESAFAALRDLVAGSKDSAPASGTSTADAPRGRASASPAKEADMAKPNKAAGKPIAALAAAKAAVKKAQAELARATAAASAAEEAPDEEDETDAPAAEGEDDEQPDAETGDEAETDAPAAEDDDETDDTTAIAASAEASAHPELALAAIQNGLTLSQFKATAQAAGKKAGSGRLASTLAGSPRVGADAPGKSASAGLNTAEIYARRNGRTTR